MDVESAVSAGTGTTPAGGGEVTLRALADQTRQAAVRLLLAEPLCVTDLAEILRVPQSTISRHLKVLRSAGLVHDRRDGTTVFYSAARGSADANDLRAVLLDWIGRQPLEKRLERRLQKALRRRGDPGVGFFERLGDQWDELRAKAFGEAFATEAFLALLPRDWSVVDIGTGTGYLLPILAQQFRRVVAVDPAPAMLECARRRVTERGCRRVTFRHGDLSRLPIRDRASDLAVACLVLHHVAEPDAALGEMFRILRPKGRALIVEQRVHENQRFQELMQDQWRGFEPGDLGRKLSAAGFREVRHHRLHTAGGGTEAIESPGLFVMTGVRPPVRQRKRS